MNELEPERRQRGKVSSPTDDEIIDLALATEHGGEAGGDEPRLHYFRDSDIVEFALRLLRLNGAAPSTESVPVDEIMTMAQEFASAWALVGTRFDDGTGMDHAEKLKAELRALIGLHCQPDAPVAQEPVAQKLIGWRTYDYLQETSDPEKAMNWSSAVGVLPVFAGDPNTNLEGRSAAPVAQPTEYHKRLLDATICDLAAISENLGIDPSEGGAVPIIEAIEELRRERNERVDADQCEQPSDPVLAQWSLTLPQARGLAAEIVAGAEMMGASDDEVAFLQVRQAGSVQDDDGVLNKHTVLAWEMDGHPGEGVYPIDPTEVQGEADHVEQPLNMVEPVAVLRYERSTPGSENEMPTVVSCNWMPDGEYRVYLGHDAAQAHPDQFRGATEMIGGNAGELDEREAFEAHFSHPPFEWEFHRYGGDSAWPGNYQNYDYQCAWEAWQARAAIAKAGGAA